MADIFISYSKADRDTIAKLAAYLQGQGYSVWWDTELLPGETFRDEIMKQLALARVALVVWTKNSIASDWVRAEAGRAKADGKLVPLKASGVQYADIPLPFGEMHTEDVSQLDLIRLAVVNQLAKPMEPLSALAVVSGKARFQLLSWLGVVGGALTILNQAQGLLKLADWLKWLLMNWHWATHAFWVYLADQVGLHMPVTLSPVLTFSVFICSLVVGVRVRQPRQDQPAALKPRRRLLIALGKIILCAAFLGVLTLISSYGKLPEGYLLLPIMFSGPVLIASIGERHKIYALVSMLILVLLWGVILIAPLTGKFTTGTMESMSLVAFGMVTFVTLPALLMVAPVRAITRRLLQLLVLIALLVAVSMATGHFSRTRINPDPNAPRPTSSLGDLTKVLAI